MNRFLEINSVALKNLLAIAEWQERWTGISNKSDIEWMGADNRTSLLKRLKKMDNNELRTYFLNKGDKLDEYVIKLQNCFGLFVPKEEYEKLLKMRSEYKCIEWEIACRFNQMEF